MIDWKRVNELRDEVGPDDFDEVIDIFLDEVETTLSAMADLPSDADIGPSLHFLKGSALNIGFQALADICGAGERIAAAGGSSGLDRHQVATCYAASKAAFLAGEQSVAA